MARSFHRRKTLAPVSELNVTSLIDLGFSLLIIFMISTPLIKNEQTLPVDLPVSSESTPRSADQKFVDVTVMQGGYAVEGNPVDRNALEALLRSYAASAKPPVLSIRTDRTIPYQEVVMVLDLCARYKLTKVSLDTQSGR